MRPPATTPSMIHVSRSSTFCPFQPAAIHAGRDARQRARPHPARKANRYMSPYQCTCTGPSERATGSMFG